ncbi:MAG TPA: metallophosphoesterase [Gemmatimonadales bacterium]|nr:metallophosphoesterase [Gemmatimonadales bacterium]
MLPKETVNWALMIKTTGSTVRIAAVGDIHLGGKGLDPPLQILFGQVSQHADVLALCGDLTDRGDPEEAKLMAKALATVTVPIVAVLGNHDYECGKEAEVGRILGDAGVRVLDGDAHEVLGIGFAGIKGFAGGFGRRALGPWGEPTIKQFVREALDEALKLETALGRLRSERKVALLHYSPVVETVVGEPYEIYPYLGSSRLEEPLSRYPVDVVFHGHAHHGAPEGRTKNNVPVYNVSMMLLQHTYPDRPPFRIVELSVGRSTEEEEARIGTTPLRRATDRPSP